MSTATANPQTPVSPVAPAPASVAEPAPVAAHASVPANRPWSMPLAAYEKIVESEVLSGFPGFRHVYLWKGRLWERMSINRPHVYGVKSVFLALHGLGLADYSPETEAPMAFRFTDSAPQPDVKVVRGRTKDFMDRMPTTADVPLVVEVADSSLAEDRALALAYAAEEIPVYWLLNLPGRRLEVYAAPVAGVYTSVTLFEPEQDVPIVLDGREVGRVRAADLLP